MEATRSTTLIGVVLLLVAGAGAFALGPAAAGTTDSDSVTVTRVVDGDTLDVRFQNGSTDTVRLLGVDTPETQGATPDEWEGVPSRGVAGRWAANCLAHEGDDAKQFIERLEGRTVTLEYDSEADRRGDFGRLLAYVRYDGEDYNYKLVKTGRARVYDSTFSRSDSYYDAESEAQSVKRDAWRCRDPGPTEAGTVDVETIEAGPAGNVSGEYIVVENSNNALFNPVDLSGWTVSDGEGNSYTFPEGTVLRPGGEVTVHTGSGSEELTGATDSAQYPDDVYWGRSDPVWESGDTVTLAAPDGSVGTTRLVP